MTSTIVAGTRVAAGRTEPAARIVNPPATAPLPAYDTIPRIQVRTLRDGRAPGYLFGCMQSMFEPEVPHGPEIVDDQGRIVWFRALPPGEYATNVRVQQYRGEPVVTWWQGSATNTGVGVGRAYVADTSYRIVASVETTGDGQPVDLHEFLLTDRGTALLVSYQVKTHDLTAVGGAEDADALDSVIEEIDLETGEVLLHWSGLEHIALEASDLPVRLMPDQPWDHLHVNAIGVDSDGHLLVTARSSSGMYKIHRETGEVLWTLGSGHSTFPLGAPGVRVNWPHDGQPVGNGVYRVFDNGANDFLEGYESRIAWIAVDEKAGEASHIRTLTHPEHLSSLAEGNAQGLPNGNTLVGWGRAGRISEFASDGSLVFDADTPTGAGWTTYRVFRFAWEGCPDTPPEAVVAGDQVHAVWNGATGVARWRLLAGSDVDGLEPVADVEWDGLDTAIPLPAGDVPRYVSVAALDDSGAVLGTSPAVPASA